VLLSLNVVEEGNDPTIVFDFLNGTGDIIDVSINDACSDLWNLAMSEIDLLNI
jgi:hypothetical protein